MEASKIKYDIIEIEPAVKTHVGVCPKGVLKSVCKLILPIPPTAPIITILPS